MRKLRRPASCSCSPVVAALAVPAAGQCEGNATCPTAIGKGEGALTLVAWEGYTDKSWVTPFEKQTGCKVTAKYAGSSDEMVSLMRSGGGGQYDMVSASGDASLRLIYGGDIAETNVSLVPQWKDFHSAFKSPSTNTVDGKHYGISLQFGPNILLYNTAKEKKPTSWTAIYDPANKGKISIPGQPDPDRRRRAVPLEDAAGARDQGPVRARPEAVRRRGRAAEAAEAAAEEVLGAGVRSDRPVQERRLHARRLVAVPALGPQGRQGAGRRGEPEGGRDGLARHVDAVRRRRSIRTAPTCGGTTSRRPRCRRSRRRSTARRR